MPKTRKVYALCEPDTGEVRYVGITSISPHRRLATHMSPANLARNTSPSSWFRSLIERGLKPVIKVLEEVPEEEWRSAEYKWIQCYREQGADLLNISPGGYVVDERIRSTMRPPPRPTTHSARQDALSSERAKKLWADPEWRAKWSASRQKNLAARTEEQKEAHRQQARQAAKVLHDNPEAQAARKALLESPEYRARLRTSAQKRATRQGEALRERMREVQKIWVERKKQEKGASE